VASREFSIPAFESGRKPARYRHAGKSARAPLGGLRRNDADRKDTLWDGDILAIPVFRKSGAHISAEFTIFPFRGLQGHPIGVAAILRDVTKRFEEMTALSGKAVARYTRLQSPASGRADRRGARARARANVLDPNQGSRTARSKVSPKTHLVADV
jgi:hypothetical protein